MTAYVLGLPVPLDVPGTVYNVQPPGNEPARLGLVLRPLGGIIGGYLGDRIGRKPVLVGSLLLMGLATVLIGCLPTYGTAGYLGLSLLVLCRLLQGFSAGVERT